MSKPHHVLNLTQDPSGVVHLHVDKNGLDCLITRLCKLRAHLENGECEHDHFMTESWAGQDLSENNQIMEAGHSTVHHLKVFGWTDEWATKHGFNKWKKLLIKRHAELD